MVGPDRALTQGWVQEKSSALRAYLVMGASLGTHGWDYCPPASCCWWALCFPNVFSLLLPADLSAAKRKFADSLNEFKFRCIGDAETDDEICIGECWGWCHRSTETPDP